MYEVWPDESFSERMSAYQDRAASVRSRGLQRPWTRVTWRRKPGVVQVTADDLATVLGVSGARARALLATGRVKGAYRARKGKNRPWIVRLYLVNGKHVPVIEAARFGPALQGVTEGRATQTTIPGRVPF